jgi:hypothetical protein
MVPQILQLYRCNYVVIDLEPLWSVLLNLDLTKILTKNEHVGEKS